MEKKITVYVVSTGEGEELKAINFPTKTRANDAIELLAKFGVEAKLETTKKTVKID